MYNKKALSKAVKNLGSAKAPAKKKDIITDPRGQWEYPGEITRIPGNDITMSGVPYPVWAVPNIGIPQMMYPGQNYNFPGANYVDEYPQMQIGGTHSTSLSDEDEMRFQKFYNTLPDNLMDDDPSYDIRGYWMSEGMPETFDYSQPKEEDGFYHAYSINADTGEYLKAPWHPTFQHAVDEDRKIGWRPVTNAYGRNIATENPSIIEPEEQSFLRNTEGPIYELTDEEIQAYRDGGYIVEELPEAQYGQQIPSALNLELEKVYLKSEDPRNRLKKPSNFGKPGNYIYNGNDYRLTNDLKWEKKINGKYVPLTKGDVARRSHELYKNATPVRPAGSYKQYQRNYDPLLDNKPQVSSTTNVASSNLSKDVQARKTREVDAQNIQIAKEKEEKQREFDKRANERLLAMQEYDKKVAAIDATIASIPGAHNNYNDAPAQPVDWVWTLPLGFTSAGRALITETLPQVVSKIGNTNLINNQLTRSVFNNPVIQRYVGSANNILSTSGRTADLINKYGTVDKVLKGFTAYNTAKRSPELAGSLSKSIGSTYDLINNPNYNWDDYFKDQTDASKQGGKYLYDALLDWGPQSKVLNLARLGKYGERTAEDVDPEANYKGLKYLSKLVTKQTGGPYQSSIVPAKSKSVAYSKSPGVNNLDQVYTYEGRPDVIYKKDIHGNWLISYDGQNYTAIKDPSGSRTKVLDKSAKPIQLTEDYQKAKTFVQRGYGTDLAPDYYDDMVSAKDYHEGVRNEPSLYADENGNMVPLEDIAYLTSQVEKFNGDPNYLENVQAQADIERLTYDDWLKANQKVYDDLSFGEQMGQEARAFFADPLYYVGNAINPWGQGTLPNQGYMSIDPTTAMKGMGNIDPAIAYNYAEKLKGFQDIYMGRESEEYKKYLKDVKDEKLKRGYSSLTSFNDLTNYLNPARSAGQAGIDFNKGNIASGVANTGFGLLGAYALPRAGAALNYKPFQASSFIPRNLSKIPGANRVLANPTVQNALVRSQPFRSAVANQATLNNYWGAEFLTEGIGNLPSNTASVYESAIGEKPWGETATELGENSINFMGTGFAPKTKALINDLKYLTPYRQSLTPSLAGVGMKKGGEKKYSRDLAAQNKLFKENKLTKKKKSKKKKTFDPNAKYYQDGGPYNTAGPANQLEDKDYSLYLMKMKQEALRGNPAAHRMLSENPVDYTYTGDEYVYGEPAGTIPGEKGTHYMSVMDNYVVPFIQQSDSGNLEFNEYASPMDSEAIRFDSPEEAQEFSENYKKAAPMTKSFQKGGQYYMYDNKYYLKDNGQWSKFDGNKFTPLSKGNVAERVKILEKNAVKMKPSQILAHSTETSKKPRYNQLDIPQASASTTAVNMPDTSIDRRVLYNTGAQMQRQKQMEMTGMAKALANEYDKLNAYENYINKRSVINIGTNPITNQKISLLDYTSEGEQMRKLMRAEGYDITPNNRILLSNKKDAEKRGETYDPVKNTRDILNKKRKDIEKILNDYSKDPSSILKSQIANEIIYAPKAEPLMAGKEFNPVKRTWEYITNPFTAFHYAVATGSSSNMPHDINEMKQTGIDITPHGVPNLIGDALNQYNPLEAGDYISRAMANDRPFDASLRALQFAPAIRPLKDALNTIPVFNASVKVLDEPLLKTLSLNLPKAARDRALAYQRGLSPGLKYFNNRITPSNILYGKSLYELGRNIYNNPQAYTDLKNPESTAWNWVKAGTTLGRLSGSPLGQAAYSNVNFPMTVMQDLNTIGTEQRSPNQEELLHLFRMVYGRKEGGEIYEDELSDKEIKRLQDLGYTIDLLD